MKKDFLFRLLKELKGTDWMFFSGTAMEVYTQGKRIAGSDIDILIKKDDIECVAQKLGGKIIKREIKKHDFVLKDVGFETKFLGIDVEVTSGFIEAPLKKGIKIEQESNLSNLFKKKVKTKYLGYNVFLIPIEDLIAQKAFMQRPKDIADLKLILFHKFNKKFLINQLKYWGKFEESIELLNSMGYNIQL